MIASLLFGFIPLLIWLYLFAGRRFFWLLRERDTLAVTAPKNWPVVVAVVPARNEEELIGRSLRSLLAQDYPGEFRVILVDDQSEDRTSEIAHEIGDPRFSILKSGPRPEGWTGKLWAMAEGVRQAGSPEFLWFTDADIAHSPDNLRQLVARAEEYGRTLVSQMARLKCTTTAEHFLIPAFVFFFDMLYPFGAVNDPKSRIAAAAGGSMLARRSALERAGGLEVIRRNIIDDCALARVMKKQGPIWLGLTDRAVSLRAYPRLGDLRRMVARSAFAQLDYSPPLLAGTLFGLFIVYVAPVFGALLAVYYVQLAAYLAWALMTMMFQPMLRFYRLSPLWGALLPLIGAFYAAFTIDSAIQHWSGKGGMWKGRAQAASSSKVMDHKKKPSAVGDSP
jgi:hopene-associated glycosyltransferase HpnB